MRHAPIGEGAVVLYLNGLLSLLAIGLWVFAIIDVVTTDAARCRNLGKGWWLAIVVFLGAIGAIVWFVAGRPQGPGRELPYRGSTAGGFPEYERPGRFAAQDSENDEEFLRRCRERAEEQRRRYRARQEREQRDDDAASG